MYTFYVLSLYLEASNSPIQFMNICDKYLSINSFICKLDIFRTNPSFYICWALFRFDYYRYSYNKYMYSLLIRFIRDGSIWYNNKRCTYLIRVSAVYCLGALYKRSAVLASSCVSCIEHWQRFPGRIIAYWQLLIGRHRMALLLPVLSYDLCMQKLKSKLFITFFNNQDSIISILS